MDHPFKVVEYVQCIFDTNCALRQIACRAEMNSSGDILREPLIARNT